VDGLAAVYPDFMNQRLDQDLDRGTVAGGNCFGHPLTERRTVPRLSVPSGRPRPTLAPGPYDGLAAPLTGSRGPLPARRRALLDSHEHGHQLHLLLRIESLEPDSASLGVWISAMTANGVPDPASR
jgi:hypothetical protein